MDYLIHLAILAVLYLITAQGYNLVFGLGRLLNFAHVSAYAIGAYTAAILSTDYEWTAVSCLPTAVVSAAVFSLLVAAISARLSEEYFALGTLAFSALVSALLINWRSLTRGVLGIPGIPRPILFGMDLSNNQQFLTALSLTAAICLIFMYWLFQSPLGRALRAQGEFIPGALALGKNVTLARTAAIVISSGFAGLSGAYFAYYLNYIDPSSFALHEMVFVLSIVVVGRPGSFWGVIASTFFLVLLPEPLRFVDFPPQVVGPMRQLLYAVILLAVVYVRREKLFPVRRVV